MSIGQLEQASEGGGEPGGSPRILTGPVRWLIATRCGSFLAEAMLNVAVGWQVFSLTGRPFDLGLVGLVQFLPAVLLVFVTGQVADRVDRRRVLLFSTLGQGVATLCLLLLALSGNTALPPLYLCLLLLGAASAFRGPAGQAMMPNLVPPPLLSRTLAWSSSASQVALLTGPSLAGLLYAFGPVTVYAVSVAIFALAAFSAARLPPQRLTSGKEPVSWRSVVAGLAFIRATPVLLGAIVLDLFAVLFGGATAMMPAYAADILHAGPFGLGLLRSAPGLGAMTTALVLAQRPLGTRSGATMFAAVALFGVATIVFGLSSSFPLSLAALVVLGASDMISVNVRTTLVSVATPDAMRGRVGAVNSVFIGASNELGEFESGTLAQLIGLVPSVVLGGVGTLAVVAWAALAFPSLRKLGRMSELMPDKGT